MTHTLGLFAHVEESMRSRPTGITFEVWGVKAPLYLNPSTGSEDVYDAKTGTLYSTEAWGNVVLERIRAIAPQLLAALRSSERIEVLRDELSECYARINGAGRTTTAESTMTSKQRVEEIRAELKTIRQANQVAIAQAEAQP